jgi:hypothetical protein
MKNKNYNVIVKTVGNPLVSIDSAPVKMHLKNLQRAFGILESNTIGYRKIGLMSRNHPWIIPKWSLKIRPKMYKTLANIILNCLEKYKIKNLVAIYSTNQTILH